jgi:hypothetical protein
MLYQNLRAFQPSLNGCELNLLSSAKQPTTSVHNCGFKAYHLRGRQILRIKLNASGHLPQPRLAHSALHIAQSSAQLFGSLIPRI